MLSATAAVQRDISAGCDLVLLNKFGKLGLISYNGHIEVHNSLLNAVLHEKPQLKED